MSHARHMFEFSLEYHGKQYVYNSDTGILYVSEIGSAMVDRRACTDQQAIRILADIMYGTVKPITQYFQPFGRDTVHECVRCGARGSV